MADITYVSTWSGWAYVALVTDAYARRILGWRVASTMTTQLVLDALEQAFWTRQRSYQAVEPSRPTKPRCSAVRAVCQQDSREGLTVAW